MTFLTMLVSARTKSAVPAVITPFVLIFIPSFLGNINSSVISRITGLLPDQLLQVSTVLNYFNVYSFGKNVVGEVPILFALYGVLTVGLPAVIYHVYRNS